MGPTLPKGAKGEMTIILDVKLLLDPKEQRLCKMYGQIQVPCLGGSPGYTNRSAF
jgi:hypothetical protein